MSVPAAVSSPGTSKQMEHCGRPTYDDDDSDGDNGDDVCLAGKI